MDLNTAVGTAATLVPGIRPFVETSISLAIVIPAVVTSLVAIWHAVVLVLQSISKIPGCSGVTPIAAKLLADTEKVDTDSGKIVQVLAQISAIKLPQGK